MGNSSRGLPPLQEKQDIIQKKLYEANMWWNDWRFQ